MAFELSVLSDPTVKEAVLRPDNEASISIYKEFDKPWWPFKVIDKSVHWWHGQTKRVRLVDNQRRKFRDGISYKPDLLSSDYLYPINDY